MNIYTFIMCFLFISMSDYKLVAGRSTYDNPSYNSDRDENLSELLSHQKKRLANDESFHEDPSVEFERGAPLYETNRYRKFEPDAGFARRDRVDESKMGAMQKRDFYDPSSNAKDASIEVILDPRAKKAVAVVENSPSHPINKPFNFLVLRNRFALVQNPHPQSLVSVVTKSGQAMYDLSGWKSKDEGPAYESDQFAPGTQQEQVVNLVYPAERTERKYATEFGSSSDYADKGKIGFKDKVIASNEREDTHKRKRNADLKKESDKRSAKDNENKSKRKSDQSKSDSKQSECPPHNTPSSAEAENKDTSNSNVNENFENKVKEVKRDTSQWSQEQLSALRNSLNHVQDTNGEVQNLRTILSSMGLIDEPGEKKRETDAKNSEKREENLNGDLKSKDDEDLNQDNLVLKRTNREVKNEEDKAAAEEPMEKRDAEDESNYEEEMNEEFDEKKDVKRANSESEVEESKDEMNFKDEKRNKRQDSEKLDSPDASPSENENKNDNSKKYSKRETEGSKEIRKNRDSQETEEEYEKRMENQIQAKIDAIKEKVKREIMEEQYKRRFKRSNQEDLPVNRKRRQAKDEVKDVKDESADKSPANPSEPQTKVVRRKRANSLPEKQMIYQGYQNADADEAEEDNEFDDNAYDGRMYNVEKRQAEDESDYYDPVRKREVESYLRQYYPEPRSRRSFDNDGFAEDNNAFHGSRRALKTKSFINRQDLKAFNSKSNEKEKLDSEYFGSFPQSYNGELTRYKRVKRDNPYK